MDTQETISIVLASDNHYAILVAALIKSIQLNHKTSESLEFYVVDDGISPKNKHLLLTLANPSTCKVLFVKAKEFIPKDLKIPIDRTAFPFTTYYRVFAPYIVPKERTKVIYMDVDMIALEDISKLWNTNLEGHTFAAVQDLQKIVSCSWGGIPNYKQLGIAPETKYFNAGLLLIDTKKWREQDIAKKVFKCLNENVAYINYADQYGLNAALYDQWLELDPRWNWFARYEHERPYVIHFLDIKPIFSSYNSVKDFQAKFYQYLNLTPWEGYKPMHDYNRLFKKVCTKGKKKFLHLYDLIFSPTTDLRLNS